MKALKMLKDILHFIEFNKIGDECNYVFGKVETAMIISSISELNKLEIKLKDAESYFEGMNTVSCKSCKHHLSDNGNFPLSCSECSLFYGNKWESK